MAHYVKCSFHVLHGHIIISLLCQHNDKVNYHFNVTLSIPWYMYVELLQISLKNVLSCQTIDISPKFNINTLILDFKFMNYILINVIVIIVHFVLLTCYKQGVAVTIICPSFQKQWSHSLC